MEIPEQQNSDTDGRHPLRHAESDFVGQARVARLATIHRSGTPSLVPVCFALIGDSHPVIVSVLDEKPKNVPDRELARVRNIRRNPHVGFIVDRYDEDWSRLAFVQVRGRAHIVTPGGMHHDDAITALREKYPQYRPMAIEQRAVIVIEIEHATSWGL